MNKKLLFSLNIPNSGKPRIVIVGGGFGGMNLLKKLSGDDFQIVLLDRYNYHTFQPLLYQVATAGLEPDSISGPYRKIIKRKKNTYFRMLKVNRVYPELNTVETTIGNLTYDYLVVATGAKVNYFNNQSIAQNAFPVKQVTHALDLRSHIFQQLEKLEVLNHEYFEEQYLNFVIVGAGPTGVEVCGALAELKSHILPNDYPDLPIEKLKIYLIEGLDRVLPAMSKQSGETAHTYLKKMGVEVKLNCLTERYDGEIVVLNNGEKIKTDTLIWAAGVKGNLIDGFDTKSIHKGKLWVNKFNQVYSNAETNHVYNNIFAIGDVAFMQSDNYSKGLPGLAQVAIQQGRHLAKNLKKDHKRQLFKPFVYKNKGVLATIGRNKSVADLPNNIKLGGFAGWFIWMIVHIMFLVGFRNKIVVFANWIWNYFTFDRGIRLILRPSTKYNDMISAEMKKEMNEAN
ncbi:MAG: NAD(P)/FAD-dependent oxidoreductase [Bacteroidales bacterium]|nr:NAD(P)/FAD-dependent oxidoreductase [Bacteroidales bacterium]